MYNITITNPPQFITEVTPNIIELTHLHYYLLMALATFGAITLLSEILNYIKLIIKNGTRKYKN